MAISYSEFVRQARELVSISERLGDGWELRSVRTTDGPEETAYLAKKRAKMTDFPNGGPPAGNIDEPETPLVAGDPENIEDDDPATVRDAPRSAVLCFEYHVVYSPSYQVPVLFFTAMYPSGKLVPLEEVWQLMSPAHVTRGSGMEWGTVTQQEHPILCRPFYHIHPCHTVDVMRTVTQTHGNETEKHGLQMETCEHGNETEENLLQNGVEVGGHGNETETHTLPSGMETCGHGNETNVHAKHKHFNYVLSWLTIFGPTVGLEVSLNYILHLKSDSL